MCSKGVAAVAPVLCQCVEIDTFWRSLPVTEGATQYLGSNCLRALCKFWMWRSRVNGLRKCYRWEAAGADADPLFCQGKGVGHRR
jgi:hypothetical protein